MMIKENLFVGAILLNLFNIVNTHSKYYHIIFSELNFIGDGFPVHIWNYDNSEHNMTK